MQGNRASLTSADSDIVALTVAICSNRIENLQAYACANASVLSAADKLLIVIDTEVDGQWEAFLGRLIAAGVVIVRNTGNQGLSYCRNVAMRRCTTNHIIFVDDDVTFTAEVLQEVRKRFTCGANVVGVRIRLNGDARLPWHLSRGQLHYLAVHDDAAEVVVWGACMGIDLGFARHHWLTFRQELGRRGRQLQSGDDTTFVREMRGRGAKVSCIGSLHVTHHVPESRKTFAYLARRVFWQGRSEVRRDNFLPGLGKEWARYRAAKEHFARSHLLSAVYLGCFVAGAAYEAAGRRRPHGSDSGAPKP